jgi:hypothetical protein
MMWRIPLILNTVLMWVFTVTAGVPMAILDNYYVQYPDEGGKPPPVFSAIALEIPWLLLAIPLVWTIALFVLLKQFHHRPPSAEFMNLHLSLSLFVGLSMLLFFVLAGVMPFIELRKGMQG